MGTGIFGAIPLQFYFRDRGWASKEENKKDFLAYSPDGFLDFYDEETVIEEKKEITYYTIKAEVLLPHFKDFFFAFCTLIGKTEELKGCQRFNKEYDAIVAANDLDAFMTHFCYEGHGYYDPFDFPYIEFMYIKCISNLTIYRGSYKAILEEYSTLYHMRKLLVAAMSNYPLAKLVDFVISL